MERTQGRVVTRYARDRQLEVAIYAARTTDKDAALYFGMPRRSVSAIRARWQDTPDFQIAKARLAARLADQYADLELRAIERARAALDDPETPPRDVARLGEWVSGQRALLTGDPTSRSENLTMNVTQQRLAELSEDERHQLAAVLDQELGLRALAEVTADPLGADRATIEAALIAVEAAIQAREKESAP